MTAQRSPMYFALMKYLMGRLYRYHPQTLPSLDEVCERQTVLRLPTDFAITWWSMWRAEFSNDCTKVTYRPCLDEVCERQTVPRSPTHFAIIWWSMWRVECSDDSAKVTYILHLHLMTYAKGRMFCWLHQGLVPTSPSLEEACKRWNVQMIAPRSPSDLGITWWCEG